jgi:hypothetical protein
VAKAKANVYYQAEKIAGYNFFGENVSVRLSMLCVGRYTDKTFFSLIIFASFFGSNFFSAKRSRFGPLSLPFFYVFDFRGK